MGAFFDSCAARSDGHRPPASVTLTADLRTNVGSEDVLLVYRLDDNNGVFFINPNGHRVKRIERARKVSSRGVRDEDTVPLAVDGSQIVAVIIHGSVLTADGRHVMDECSSQLPLW